MSTCVTFMSGHYYASLRKAGFHHLADAAHRLGYTVNFVTVGYSLLSVLHRDYRTRIPGIRENYNKPLEIRPGFVSYVHFTLWHPHTLVLPGLDRLTWPLMDCYGEKNLGRLLPLARETDIFIFESTSGLFLFNRFRRENPAARMIYRVSDDLRILRSTHPRLLELEREIAPDFNVVSVPCPSMLTKFPGHSNLRLDRSGIDRAAYDARTQSPFPDGTTNVVFCGTWELDTGFLQAAAAGNPGRFFHIIGPVSPSCDLPNVRFYGEMPFAASIPYVKHADAGLHCIAYRNEHSRCFTDTLKVLQYRYCALPIVAPEFLDLRRDGVFYYQPGDAASCAGALRNALAAKRDAGWAREVQSWEQVFQDMLTDARETAG